MLTTDDDDDGMMATAVTTYSLLSHTEITICYGAIGAFVLLCEVLWLLVK